MKRVTICILLLAAIASSQDFGFFYGTPNETAGNSNVVVGVNNAALSNRVAEVAIQANAAQISLATQNLINAISATNAAIAVSRAAAYTADNPLPAEALTNRYLRAVEANGWWTLILENR